MLLAGPVLFVLFMIASFIVEFISMKERIVFAILFGAGFLLPPPYPFVVAIGLDLILTLMYKFRTS